MQVAAATRKRVITETMLWATLLKVVKVKVKVMVMVMVKVMVKRTP